MELDVSKIEASVEAILFAMGEAVSVDRLSVAIGHDVDTTRRIIHNMMDKYENNDRGIKVIELEDSFQLCTKNEYYDNLIKLVNTPKKHMLTDVLLETLSIIAYKQPITRQEIESIRGVKCDHAVNKLVEFNLVCEVGRLEAIGRPILFGTTDDFLRSFGVSSIEDLPIINQAKVEDFRQEAMEEAQLTLKV